MDREWVDVTTFGDLLVRGAQLWPDHDAVVFPDTRHTYASLLEAAERSARSLLGLGVTPGQHVGILMPNCMDYIEVMFGAAILGAWVIPINARFKGQEISYVLENGDIDVLFTSDIIDQHTDYVEILNGCFPELADAADVTDLRPAAAPKLRSIVLLGSSSPQGMLDRAGFEALAEGHDTEYVHLLRSRVAIRDVAMMMYTSGTTAEPKGCPMTHEQLVRTSVTAGRNRFEFTPEDVFWDPLPMFHMSTILPMIGCFDAGSTFVTLTHFDPATAIAQIRGENATMSFSTFPTVTQALLNHPDADDFPNIRLWNNVSSPDGLRKIHASLPHAKHINAYGLTECGGVVAFNEPSDPDEIRPISSGTPFRGIELRIRDMDTGEWLDEPGQRGQIWCRGYSVFEGYYKDAEKNAECFDDEGWFNTGDLGALDPEGRISYMGRFKDMLKVGGENVAAIEIESFIQTNDAISIAQVVAVPDEKYVEVPAAFVEFNPGASVTEEELIEFCKGEISSFKIPRYVREVKPGTWPMSGTKIQKFRLREDLCKELGIEMG
ncbi:MAG: class I adenylate-forming enzyme family protein [Acidimicrobiales bacterium]